MKKLCLMACVTFAVLAATPAKADFVVIRWKDGTCEVWDNAERAPPRRLGRYVKLSVSFATWVEALAAMNGLHTMGQCARVSSGQR